MAGATLAVTGLAYFAVSVLALHGLRADYDPVIETVSQYAVGPYGYIMTAAFFALSLSVVGLALGLLRGVAPVPRVAGALLGVAGVCVFLVAVFPIDRTHDARPISELVHNAAFMASFFATIVSMLILTAHFRQDARWHPFQHISLALSLTALVGFVAFMGTYDTPWRGAVQRFSIVTILLWLMLASARLRSVAVGKHRPTEAYGLPRRAAERVARSST